ncbi:GTPase Era [Selenomonadales bacterium OttesenSCG-928-I06]|nr:GTPase Era [Selenomonadales bacterium OttesenSCG-928-I06]
MNNLEEFVSGFVAVIGRPNVGKSTLMNNVIGQKVAIMSDKPQTTRNKILGVHTLEDAQILFIDTPGIHKPKHKLGEAMAKSTEGTLKEVDVILFVVDVTMKMKEGERYILGMLEDVSTPVILVINKIDKVAKEEILKAISSYKEAFDFAAIVPISAQEKDNIDGLITEIKKHLSKGPKYYPDDMITDQPERLIVAELIREKALELTREEIPHALLVDIEEITLRNNNKLFIRAIIYVERESQKGIVVGKNGSLLKEIGQKARHDIETLLGNEAYLDLWVKVKKDWRNKDTVLKNFGFEI